MHGQPALPNASTRICFGHSMATILLEHLLPGGNVLAWTIHLVLVWSGLEALAKRASAIRTHSSVLTENRRRVRRTAPWWYSSDYTRLFEGEITCLPWRRLADNHVVQKTNVQDSCGFVDLPSQSHIGSTGIWVPREVIMYQRKGVSRMKPRASRSHRLRRYTTRGCCREAQSVTGGKGLSDRKSALPSTLLPTMPLYPREQVTNVNKSVNVH